VIGQMTPGKLKQFKILAAFVMVFAALWLIAGCGDDKTTGPKKQVPPGTLLVQTDDGMIAADLAGESFVFADHGGKIEVIGNRIFAGIGTITEFDHQGDVIRRIFRPAEVPNSYNLVVLPDTGFAFLANHSDTISIIDSVGNFVTAMEMPEATPGGLQNVSGICVGNRLIVSETGTRKVVAVDLLTYEASVFKDLTGLSGWLSDIDYSDGTYYICQAQKIHSFTETGDVFEVCEIDTSNITAIAVVDDYAYIAINFAGRVYKVDLATGDYGLFLDGLNYPQDIEFIGVDLEPQPVGH
jgi:DNA-binding beta-propeller fold protein YncE